MTVQKAPPPARDRSENKGRRGINMKPKNSPRGTQLAKGVQVNLANVGQTKTMFPPGGKLPQDGSQLKDSPASFTNGNQTAGMRRAARRRENRRQARLAKVQDKITDQNIKVVAVQNPSSLMAQMNEAAGLEVSGKKDLVTQIMDFFDYESDGVGPVCVVKAGTLQDLFNPSPGNTGQLTNAGEVLKRIRRVEVFMLPLAVNNSTPSSTVIACLGVGSKNADGHFSLIGCTNVVIHPTFNIDWKKVMDYNVDQLFTDNMALPDTAGVGVEIFRFAILDPDSGDQYKDSKIQVMYKVTYENVLPIMNKSQVGVEYVATWSDESKNPVVDTFVLNKVIGVENCT